MENNNNSLSDEKREEFDVTDQEILELKNSIKKKNSDFAKTVMTFLERHQILTNDNLSELTKRERCRELFYAEYPMLLEIDSSKPIGEQIRDKTGRTRFYKDTYCLNGKHYVMNSQLYGLGDLKGRHKDNRTPFLNWILMLVGGGTLNVEEAGKDALEMDGKEAIKRISDYIESKGFSYEGNLIENFYLSLKSKPFVILAGTSGTGKTRLVKLFSEAIGAEYKLVPVRPDWSDSTDLFGHLDLNGKFVPGAIIDFLKAAQEDAERPYILCLDEMNLARVEYYLSDFLSVIETREHNGSQIISDPLITKDKYGTDEAALVKYGELIFPDNLYVVGTVNMDETTFPFSKKVLDRANTIEFSYVNLNSVPKTVGNVEKLTVNNNFLKTEFLFLTDCNAAYSGYCDQLQSINEILQEANAHIGYRVRDEIVFYMLNNENAGYLISEEEAFDNAIMQKILPRVQGSSSSVKTMLCDLFAYCVDGSANKDFNDSDKMKQYLGGNNKCFYRKSADKIAMKVHRFEEDGFTAYWL